MGMLRGAFFGLLALAYNLVTAVVMWKGVCALALVLPPAHAL